jgi:N-glycosylase/DNA lyase
MRLAVPFDLDLSLCCGQVFRWQKLDGWWYGVVGDRVLKVRQCGAELEFAGADEKFVQRYFGLDLDLAFISRCIAKDFYIKDALKQFKGLRLLRQEPWECLVSFVCSIQKNIPAIEQMLTKISSKFGEKRLFEGKTFYLFPNPQRLASADVDELRSCSLGFRAKYVAAAARKIFDEAIDLNSLKTLPYLQAQKALLEFCGVGQKVADCVLLFSLDKTEAFPVDVWVKRVILNRYADKLPPELAQKLQSRPQLINADYRKIGDWARGYFGVYAGYAQEYLFHFERTQR